MSAPTYIRHLLVECEYEEWTLRCQDSNGDGELWSTVLDNVTCPKCLSLSAQDVLSEVEPFAELTR